MKRLVFVLLAFVASTLPSPNAQAFPLCTAKPDSGQPWGSYNIKVYIHYNPGIFGGPGMGLRYALELSETNTEYIVLKTLHILNEEAGGRIKLQYAGTVTSDALISNAVVLRSSPDICSDGDQMESVGTLANSELNQVNGVRTNGRVNFYFAKDATCQNIPFNLSGFGAYDIARVLIHELGHAFYDVGHPQDDPTNCLWNASYQSIMVSAPPPRPRLIQDWDREAFQRKHAVRGGYSDILRSHRNTSSWQTPFSAGFPAVFQYRPGSITQNVTNRNLGFIAYDGITPNPTGGGYMNVRRYEGKITGFSDAAPDGMMRPIATAGRPTTQEVFVAYIKRVNPDYGASSDIGQVCHRRSTNNGVSFGAETCPGWSATANGLTAAYSSRGNVFVVGFIGLNQVAYLGAVPASGSFSSTTVVSTGFQAWHAPAVACRSSSTDMAGCRMVWEGFTNTGCATSLKFGLDPATSTFYFPSSVGDDTPCIPMFDTPGLAYNPATDVFEMASTWWNDTIYSYKQSSSTLDWTFDGNIWAVPNSFVLSPVLAYRYGGTSPRFQAWFVKYFQP